MIVGRFDDWGRPIMRARLIIPRLGITGWVNFLVDTGAINTCLHPYAGRRLRIPFDELRAPHSAIGIGGSQAYYQEPALVMLTDSDGEHRFRITLSIAKPQPLTPSNPRPIINRIPSLLGRDVLNRLRIDYDHPGGRLRFFP